MFSQMCTFFFSSDTLLASIEASFLKTIAADGTMPPVAANTKGEKQALSTS